MPFAITAHVSVDGLVFIQDPASRSNDPAVVATASNATLNPWRQTVTLSGLTAPAAGAQQALSGGFVRVSDTELPTVASPSRQAQSLTSGCLDTFGF